jgi:hypothetical protein
MPRLFADRLERSPDCVAHFHIAAQTRCHDALLLAEHGASAAAIYFWGYAVEMLLKAAYFRLIGYTSQQVIALADLRRAVKFGQLQFKVPFAHRLHDIDSWARLLIEQRRHLHRPYSSAGFAAAVHIQAQIVHQRWREFIRYKPNVPYRHEVERVGEAANWFVNAAHRL